MERDDARVHGEELFNARRAEFRRQRIDEGDVTRPARAAVDDVGAPAAALREHRGIILDVLRRRVVDLLERHPQLLVDPAPEVLQAGMREARLIVGRRDVAVLIRPLVHREDMDVATVDPQHVDRLRDRFVDGRTRIRQHHGQTLVEHVAALNPGDHVGNPHAARVGHDCDAEVRIGMAFEILAADLANAVEDFAVPVRDEIGYFECEHDSFSLMMDTTWLPASEANIEVPTS